MPLELLLGSLEARTRSLHLSLIPEAPRSQSRRPPLFSRPLLLVPSSAPGQERTWSEPCPGTVATLHMPTRWRSRPGAGLQPHSPPRARAGVDREPQQEQHGGRATDYRRSRPRDGHRQPAKRQRRSAEPEGSSGQRLQTQGWDCPRLGMGASLLLGAALPGQLSDLRSPSCKHPSAAFCVPGGLGPLRSLSGQEAA